MHGLASDRLDGRDRLTAALRLTVLDDSRRSGLDEDRVDRVPGRVVQLASDPRSLLGDREALLARDTLALLRGPLPCQASAIADDPAARPQERGDRVVTRFGFEASPGHGKERRVGGDADDQREEGVLSPVAL